MDPFSISRQRKYILGIDNYIPYLPKDIPLTNAKGAFSSILAEFVALGYLYFDKKVKSINIIYIYQGDNFQCLETVKKMESNTSRINFLKKSIDYRVWRHR